MNKKLKKTIETSIQGIWLVIILSIVVNIFGVITSDSFLKYIETYWVTFVYIAGLATALVMYNKGKCDLGAEIVQWVGLSCMIITFANALIVYVITGTLGYGIWLVLLAVLLSILLIIEALKVIKLAGEYKSSYVLMVISTGIIVFAISLNLISARNLKIEVDKENINKDNSQQTGILGGGNSNQNTQEIEDPYEKQKAFKWGESKVTNQVGEIFQIVGNQIHYIDVQGNVNTISVVGMPYKLINGGGIIYILTKEGYVYYLDSQKTKFKFAEVSQYNAIDITYSNNNTNESVYFLTKEGNVVDRNGVSHSRYNFTGKQRITIGEVTVDLSFDKDGGMYYYNGLSNAYEIVENKAYGEQVTAKELYVFNNEILIVSKFNMLYRYDGKSNGAEFVHGNVKNISIVGEKKFDLIVAFKDMTVEKYSSVKSGYNVGTKKEIAINKLPKYDAYQHYNDVIWAGITTINAKIKNNILYIAGKDRTSEITGKLKSIEETESNGVMTIYVLTQEGNVWLMRIDKINNYNVYEKRRVLSSYNIVNMTTKMIQDGEQEIYFLTNDGKLLDEKGEQYVKN